MPKYEIYYFGNSTINQTNSVNSVNSNDIIYNFQMITKWSSTEEITEKLTSILDQASKTDPKNIFFLIYFEDLTKEYCDVISNLLIKYTSKGDIFMGVSIYNKTLDAHVSIQHVYGFRKIVNIFPFDRAIKICDQTVFDTIRLINKTITVSFDPTKPLEKCYDIWYEDKNKKQYGGDDSTNPNIQIFNFRLMKTNNSTELENTWWFKYYFSIPPCAFGRLAQSTGTCWLNVALNILFLSEPIADILIKKYHSLSKEFKTLVEKISFRSDIFILEIPLKDLLWCMVNRFLINSNKAITLDQNFIGVVASKVKGLWEHNNEKYFIENNLGIEYGDGLISYFGFITVCSIYFEENVDYYALFNKYALMPKTREFTKSSYDEYYELKSNLTDKSLEKLKKLELFINTIDKLHDYTCSIVSQMNETNKQISLKLNDIIFTNTQVSPSELPKLLIIPTVLTTKIHQIIYIDDAEYKLIAGGIKFNMLEPNSTHIVSGLICDDKYYIYDSNNILSFSNWNQGLYNDYIEQLNDYYGVNGYRFNYINEYIIYIKV